MTSWSSTRPPEAPRRPGPRGKPLAAALALFVLLALAYAFSIGIRGSRGGVVTGDEPFYLLTTQSLLRDGDLDLRNQYETQAYREWFDHPDGLWYQSVPAGDGRILSPHNPGLSVYLVPGYALGGLVGAQIQMLLTAAAAFALAFVLALRITGRPGASWWATLGVGVAATPFVYATEIYPEVPAAAVMVGAVLAMPHDRGFGWRRGAVLAGLLSLLPWLGVKYAVLSVVVGVAAFVRGDRAGRRTLAGLGLASAAVFVGWHLGTFGGLTPYGVNTVYAGWSTSEILASHVSLGDRLYRLWGLFVDRRFGLARWAPLLLLAVPGLVWMLRRRAGGPRETVVAAVMSQVLVATFVAITMMGWWFPGRTLMTVVPLLAAPVAVVLAEGGPRVRALAVGLGVWTAAITAALAVAGHAGEITVAVDPFDLSSPVFAAPAGLFPQYTAWGPGTVVLTVAWLGLAGVVLGPPAWRAAREALRRRGRSGSRGPASRGRFPARMGAS